ncbi:hypothetical protein BJX65DRAFT_85771 [Aspergillus insuetus]
MMTLTAWFGLHLLNRAFSSCAKPSFKLPFSCSCKSIMAQPYDGYNGNPPSSVMNHESSEEIPQLDRITAFPSQTTLSAASLAQNQHRPTPFPAYSVLHYCIPSPNASHVFDHGTNDLSTLTVPSNLASLHPATAAPHSLPGDQTTNTADLPQLTDYMGITAEQPSSGMSPYPQLKTSLWPLTLTHSLSRETPDGSLTCLWPRCPHRGEFKSKGCIKRHTITQHLFPNAYGCEVCGKKFNRSDNLRAHFRRKHSDGQ